MINVCLSSHIKNDRILETCGYFPNYVVYLLHQTPAAKQAGKAPYDESEYITNLSDDELKIVLGGYNVSKRKLTAKARAAVIEKIREAGCKFEPYDDLIKSFGIYALSPDDEGQFRRAYRLGYEETRRLTDRINRLHIEVLYPSLDYHVCQKIDQAIFYALSDKRYLTLSDDNSASIEPSTEALVYLNRSIADNKLLQKLSTSHIVDVNKPFSVKKSIWAGSILVSTAYVSDSKYSNYYKDYYKKYPDAVTCIISDNNELIFKEFKLAVQSKEEQRFYIDTLRNFKDRMDLYLESNAESASTDSAKQEGPPFYTVSTEDILFYEP